MKRSARDVLRAERREAWARRTSLALRVLAALYLASLALDGAGCSLPSRVLPRPLSFFTQVAALFPHAARATIDYRAEAWVCSQKAWIELDTRPYFPIAADDKENRFARAMFFYRRNRPTMRALDRYLVRNHDERPASDGIDPEQRIGGVRLLSLRIPIPTVGSSFERYRRYPLAHYPKGERKIFYHTPSSMRARRCASDAPGRD
jgi:hypothetical protein